jgi:hypothetical protein
VGQLKFPLVFELTDACLLTNALENRRDSGVVLCPAAEAARFRFGRQVIVAPL